MRIESSLIRWQSPKHHACVAAQGLPNGRASHGLLTAARRLEAYDAPFAPAPMHVTADDCQTRMRDIRELVRSAGLAADPGCGLALPFLSWQRPRQWAAGICTAAARLRRVPTPRAPGACRSTGPRAGARAAR